MEGVRVKGVDPQCTKELLWNYFGDPKYGGGIVKTVYYPLLNNDAVILFKDPSVTTHVLGHKHERFTVVPLPHQVFRKMQVWVDSEMSALLQATEVYYMSLKDQGGLQISSDTQTQQLILTGETYQIEWAQTYLSQLKDNQIHIARTLQRELETTAAFEYERQAGTNTTNIVNGDGHDRFYRESVAVSRPHSSLLSVEAKASSLSAVDSEKGLHKRHFSSLTSDTNVKSADTAIARPRESIHAQHNASDIRSSGFSPHSERIEDITGEFSEISSTLEKMTKDIEGSDYEEQRHRQADANDTFNSFTSSPDSMAQRRERELPHPRQSDLPDKRHSPRPWKTVSGRSDLEKAERAHLSEHHYRSLDQYGAAADHQHLQPYSSLQPGQAGTDFRAEGAGAYGGERSLRPSVLHRSLSHGASPRASDISPYALMSNASIELSRRSFRISDNMTLKMYVDDITKARTEAVVNAANWELKNIGGVAGALARAAGPEMAIDCDRLNRQYGPLKTGQVVKTKAYGKLDHLKYVLHTVGPIFLSGKIEDEEKSVYQLAQTFLNCLEFADKLHLRSLTFPFISTGIFGMPMEQCVLAIVTALRAYSHTKDIALREVHFINNDIDVVCEAIIMTEQRLSMETVPTAKKRLEEGTQHYGRSVYPFCFDSHSSLGGKFRKEEKYAHSSSTAGASASAGTYSRRGRYLDEEAEPQSMPVLSSQTDLQKTGSLDRSSRPKAQDDSTVSCQRQGREPSPRPASVSSRPRSSSLGARDKRKDLTGKRSNTVPADSPKGKSTPTLKPALIATQAGKKSSSPNVAARLSSGSATRKGNHPVKAVSKGGRSSDHSGVSDTDSASIADSEDGDGSCPICLELYQHPKKLPCGHMFCAKCLDRALATKPKCPKCQRNFGIQTGTQPKNGRMAYRADHSTTVPGYSHPGVIIIDYFIPGGVQEVCHPQPGLHYGACNRTAYLPYTAEGKEVLRMLEKAFDHRLIFTIGDSHTTGATGVITWNDIHHKTSITGGPTNFGYPDPDYLKRVKEELADKGITSP